MIAITEITRPPSLGRASSVSAWSLRSWSLRSLTFPARPVNGRTAFTLVELLVTIAIISILATALLGAASLAGGTAREARTKARILRIHPLLMEHYDTYKNRRVELRDLSPMSTAELNAFKIALNLAVPPQAASPGIDPQTRFKARHRLAAARELMKMEIPDRWSDVALPFNGQPIGDPLFLAERSGLNQVYLRKYRQLLAKVAAPGSTVTLQNVVDNQGAECLYLTIMNATADGEARSLFSEHTIGDTDGDGAQEFIDGWGNPIEFLRWAPDLRSDMQLKFQDISNLLQSDFDEGKEVLASDPDPFDIYRVGQLNVGNGNNFVQGYRLVPIIYSAGPDEEYGLSGGPDDNGSQSWRLFVNELSDPYYKGTNPIYIGNAFGEQLDPKEFTHIDNITNHLIVGN